MINRILDYGKYSYQNGDFVHKAKGSRDDSYIYVDDLRIKNNKIINEKATIKDCASNYDKGFYIGTNTPFTYNDENYCLKYNNELWKCDENWNILNKIDKSVKEFFNVQLKE